MKSFQINIDLNSYEFTKSLTQVELQAVMVAGWQDGESKVAQNVVDGECPPEP